MRRPPLTVTVKDAPSAVDAADLRCTCGCLLARVTAQGLELKCRRCRRHLLVSVNSDGSFAVKGNLLASPTIEEARG